MNRTFLDSSALVKRYIQEPGSSKVISLFEGQDPIVVSRLSHIEVLAAIARRVDEGGLDDGALDVVVPALEEEFRTRFDVVELSGAAMARASCVAQDYVLGAAQAIQLACALMIARSARTSDGFILVSADEALNEAAEEEGLVVVNPEDPGAL